MNLVHIAGNLGADVEERFTSGGKKVITLRVATKVRSGKEDVTVWWRVSIWGDKFDKMLPYLKKGSGVIVVGDMGKPETYVDKEGKTQIALSMTAEIIKFSPFGKPKSEGGGESSGYKAPSGRSNSAETPSMNEEMALFGAGSERESGFASDDLPF